jgi:tetratricopeptide (TPR) repeat protein
MGRPEAVLPHYSFFEALAGMDESSAEWGPISAGLVTLRLFDAWVQEGARVVASDSWTLRAVREAISAIDPRNSVRALLKSIVDSMEASRTARVAVVAPRLMAYARALQYAAKWSLAADVYRTVLEHVDTEHDADVAIAAGMQLGACLRVMARWDEALEAYTTAGEIAARTDDIMNVLKSRIAEANVALDRGNIPAAEMLLDETIERATEHGLTELRAFALQDRGIVAFRRGDFEKAIRCSYEALGTFKDQVAKDRALADLAVEFYEMGLLSAARDANLMLAATAQEQYTRWAAMINLLEIAARDGREPIFEQYRRELGSAELPAVLAANYYYYVGQGYRLFDKRSQAEAALQRALEIASRHQLNEMIFKAEQSLEELRDGNRVAALREATPTATVSEVANAIREMRALAGVGD